MTAFEVFIERQTVVRVELNEAEYPADYDLFQEAEDVALAYIESGGLVAAVTVIEDEVEAANVAEVG